MTEEPKIQNVTFDELHVGQSAGLKRTMTHRDIELFAIVSGDVNPAHLDENFAKKSLFHGIVGHGMWTATLISTVLGTILPGPGTIFLGEEMQFRHPVHVGDEVTVQLTVKSKHADKPVVVFSCTGTNQNGEIVIEGSATVLAPTEKISVDRPHLPSVELHEPPASNS